MVTSRLLPTLFGLVLVVLLALLRLGDPLPVATIRDMGFDLEQRLLPRAAMDSPVRVVDIDEAALAKYGQWPWPRSLLAQLTDRLTELGAASIGFDVLFAEADRLSPDNDRQFAAALGRANAVLGFSLSAKAPPLTLEPKGGVAVSGSDPTPALPRIAGAIAPLAGLAATAAGLGGLSLNGEDAAGTVRRVPLLWSRGTSLYPGLSIEALRLALGVETLVALGDTGGRHTLDGLRIGGFAVPTTANGDLVLYDKAPGSDRAISAAALLDDGYLSLKDEIAGRIVLIGTSASGLLDLHATPLSPNVPGVFIHAAVIEQIVSGQFLSRADWVQGLELLASVLAGALLVVVVMRLGPIAGLLVALVLIAAMIAAAWAAFAGRGWLVDATFPAFGAVLTYGAMVYFQFSRTERDRRQLRHAFGHYVAPELLRRIEASAGELKLGGEAREITVMFADMRGFTAFTEAHAPEETLGMLNTLFGALGNEIVSRSGTIDKFIGDSIMAFWNAPVDVADHARRASEAALAMRGRLKALNSDGGLEGVAVGIGLSTGEALVGNMGLESRFDYSAIGDSVNVASRVEGASKTIGFDIVASESTRAAAPDLAWLEAGTVQLKGKARRLAIHILVGDAALAQSEAFGRLRAAHTALMAAFRDGQGGEVLSQCRELAAAIAPGLARFYELLPDRLADFMSPA
ncbi:MAG: adenylate/guanylate cyclase domain-containing protein [Devosia nanyangense]|uniref:Adenylate/guanylate cyclase domain-containing protein n=1 Tax=Devosia nanyangense TaxID=1228055 RepID=A0A933NYD6_9HYPH|nr:adenylate/guanylate cyclase domain-containing protein [Devosia nanyangense]